ncbi:ribosomal RNA small subunit methyltransferase H [Actinorhabdospora filicis]|uniref:Ribosomal RNA small subunit methyltransferase H n=1 Tax=Actinorhabdospora filicis TaxID=1785913 RepID=A0A9W6W878_9ACTN|nr:16S rRNA (cytosine(1402)-N(4))-methyltransferase RsmH [Actinorhabdospora filicis]GLZ75380.1 ribosomal RNA small subunit methyltransferase H [Actinorhabdospora filicis]
MAEQPVHVPVMLEPVLDALAPALTGRGDVVCVDATLGLGGHSEAILERFPSASVIGLDRDPNALKLAGERLARFGDRFTAAHAIYDELPRVLRGLGVPAIDGILFDLGVSSMQLDEAERGFAYAQDAPLDMRMDPTTGRTAEEIVNTYDVRELTRILREYGEEKFAPKVAKAIVAARARERITSSRLLADLVRDAIPAAARRTGGHPAKRAFQALRIEVNAELEVLSRALPAALDALTVGGRIAVLSYHSLEDRITKRAFAPLVTSSSPPGLPVELPGTEPTFRLLTRGAELPDEAETAANPRAASARMRAAERIRPGHHAADQGEDQS